MEFNIKKLYKPPYLTEVRFTSILDLLLKNRDGKTKNKRYMKEANELLEKNVIKVQGIKTRCDNGVLWKGNESRSYYRLLHGHKFLESLVWAYNSSQELKYLEKGMEIIKDWIKCKDKGSMAYHDDATAVRLEYYLFFYIWSRNTLPRLDIKLLEQEMWKTADLLASVDFHSTGTNHGMYQDVSLLLHSLYFYEERNCAEKYVSLAVKRLRHYFEIIFTKEGVHKEHSPAYHFWILDSMRKTLPWIKEFNLTSMTKLEEIMCFSKDYSTHIFYPNGTLPPLCDSMWIKLPEAYHSLYSDECFLYARTGGKEGKSPLENDKVFMDSGYAIFRDDWSKKENATYILFTAAYHVGYHKHSDDLNLFIYRSGEIITESGPNGYDYKDPFTEYAYSSFAHNTLLVDGMGLVRSDKQYDKVKMINYKIGEEYSKATGINKRYKGVVHKREVSYYKNDDYICVVDDISSDKNHEYTLLWHMGADIHIQSYDGIIELFRDATKIMEIEILTDSFAKLSVCKGQIKPIVQGWKFIKKVKQESGTISFKIMSTKKTEIVKTIFRMSDFKILEAGLRGFQQETITYNKSKQFKLVVVTLILAIGNIPKRLRRYLRREVVRMVLNIRAFSSK